MECSDLRSVLVPIALIPHSIRTAQSCETLPCADSQGYQVHLALSCSSSQASAVDSGFSYAPYLHITDVSHCLGERTSCPLNRCGRPVPTREGHSDCWSLVGARFLKQARRNGSHYALALACLGLRSQMLELDLILTRTRPFRASEWQACDPL